MDGAQHGDLVVDLNELLEEEPEDGRCSQQRSTVRAGATVEKPKPSAGLHPPGMGAALVMRGMQLDETKSNSSVPYLRRPPVQSSSSMSHGTGTNGSYSLNTAAGSSASTLLMGRGPITGVEVISVSFRQPSPSPFCEVSSRLYFSRKDFSSAQTQTSRVRMRLWSVRPSSSL